MAANVALRQALVKQAEDHFDAIMPGYTHMQHAQPVLFSHHMLAYVWMLARDFERLAAPAAPPTRARSDRRRSQAPRTRSTAI